MPRVVEPKQVVVIGGGPAGMKAAAVAAERGHRVTLHEASGRLGGQALLAQRLPGREEFGGMVTNLERELSSQGVRIEKRSRVDVADIRALGADAVIVATGARPYLPEFEGSRSPNIVSAWQAIEDPSRIGASVVVADWRADWIGLGLAEMLTRAGSHVTLCTNAAMAGETLQLYTRNHYVGRLHSLGVSIRTHARLFGVDGDTAYFQDTLTQQPITFEKVDTVVLALGHTAEDSLANEAEAAGFAVISIGDCVAPRTAEEAIYEGFLAGREI